MDDQRTPKQLAEDWFRLDWYADSARFEPLDWSKQISKRLAIKQAFLEGDGGKNTLEFLMSDLIAEPLAFSRSRPYSNTSEAVASLPYATGSVIPLSLDDLERLISLRNDFPEHAESAVDYWSRHHEQLALTKFGHLKVDLNARDDEILKAFDQWLKASRELVGSPAGKPYRNRTAELKDWCDSKILPYFDLGSWGNWKRIHLSDDDLIDLLYPDDDDRSRHWLRSVSDKTAKVISLENVYALSLA